MKNPFENNDHKVLIAGIIVGSVLVGAAAYLFLTETGGNIRRELTGHLNRVKDAVAGSYTGDGDEPRNPVAGPENV